MSYLGRTRKSECTLRHVAILLLTISWRNEGQPFISARETMAK
jgi:hypothetical protein